MLHGALSSVLQDEDGQILEAHSVSAGLDYPGVGPEHAFLRDSGRVRYESVTDDEALAAFRELSRLEGIIPALEPAHAIAWVLREAGAGGRVHARDAQRARRQGPRRGPAPRWLRLRVRSSAIAAAFSRPDGRAALMPYLMGGFPDTGIVAAGGRGVRRRQDADLVEVGVPFSDPLADGPAIQAAGQRALEAGATFERVLDEVAAPLAATRRRWS